MAILFAIAANAASALHEQNDIEASIYTGHDQLEPQQHFGDLTGRFVRFRTVAFDLVQKVQKICGNRTADDGGYESEYWLCVNGGGR